MRLFAVLFLLSILISACGSEEEQKAPPPPPSPASGKWDPQVMQQQTQRCASKGGGGYSVEQWTTFCGCVYAAASQRWSYEDFKNKFQEAYDVLKRENVIRGCADKAQIRYQ